MSYIKNFIKSKGITLDILSTSLGYKKTSLRNIWNLSKEELPMTILSSLNLLKETLELKKENEKLKKENEKLQEIASSCLLTEQLKK